MKILEFKTIVQEYSDFSELGNQQQNLLEKAIEARKKAYSPYSHFSVGAAVELKDGTFVTGNNQENIAFPSGLCAERTVLFYANANHPGIPILRMAISSASENVQVDYPVYPCGACRQVMAEYENISGHPIEIILMGATGKVHIVNGLINLMPLAFDNDNIKIN